MLKSGDTLVIASHNLGKIKEMEMLLTPLGFKITSARALGLQEPDENGETFLENSQLKAIAIANETGQWALADDSGLAIDALGGDPGIFSARWAEISSSGTKDFSHAYNRIFTLLKEQSSSQNDSTHTAQVHCVMTLAHAPTPENPLGYMKSFEGCVKGTVSLPPRGTNGFGYDPIFTPEGYSKTFGEMDPSLKSRLSHRYLAITKFMDFINGA